MKFYKDDIVTLTEEGLKYASAFGLPVRDGEVGIITSSNADGEYKNVFFRHIAMYIPKDYLRHHEN